MKNILVLFSNYKKIEIEMIDDKICIVDNNEVSIENAINYANKLVYPFTILRGDIFDTLEKEINGKIQLVYVLFKSLNLSNIDEHTLKNNKSKKIIKAEIADLLSLKELSKDQLIDIFEFINKK
jgi:hypothetical protein